MKKVGIIGGGVAGIGAAYTLMKAGVEVYIFDQAMRLGGDCYGIDVTSSEGQVYRVDAGVSDFNRATFKQVHALLDDLGLEYKPVNQDASFMMPDGETVWCIKDRTPSFRNFAGNEGKLVEEITRFNKSCIEVLDNDAFDEWTAKRYLDHRGYSEEFRKFYFDPRSGGSFPMPDDHPENFPIQSITSFWRMHGLVGPGPADRMCVVGGMHEYCNAFQKWFTETGGQTFCSTRVVGVRRGKDSVRVRTRSWDEEHHTFMFDQVIMATESNGVVPVFEDATPEETASFLMFPSQRAQLVVHQDRSLMPRDEDAWGGYNYIVSDGTQPETYPVITFFTNRISQLPDHVPDTFVTMNPHVEPAEEKTISNRFFMHPVATGRTTRVAMIVDAIQGRNRTWYCGSYLKSPFVHEPALETGLLVADRMLTLAA